MAGVDQHDIAVAVGAVGLVAQQAVILIIVVVDLVGVGAQHFPVVSDVVQLLGSGGGDLELTVDVLVIGDLQADAGDDDHRQDDQQGLHADLLLLEAVLLGALVSLVDLGHGVNTPFLCARNQ